MVLQLFVAACLLSLIDLDPDQSMRVLAKRHETKAVDNVISEHFDAKTPSELAAIADTVVRGRIVEVTPHFTADESLVVTDYRILPEQFITRDPKMDSASRPGSTRGMLVRRKGGTVTEDGVRYTTWLTAYNVKAGLSVGEDVVLFLSYDDDEKAYYFSGGPYGVYRIRSGAVIAMARVDQGGERSMGSVDDFIDRVRRSAGRKQP
jgi:hypothetical protein